MAVDPLSSALASQSSGTDKANQTLGQNEFLKLMMTQLKNQDPMKPLDPSQFVGQLAQFSTVTGIQNMQGSIDSLVNSQKSSQLLGGSSLVGHDVLAPADTATITSGGTVSGGADVPSGTASLQVQVSDSSGQLVRTFSVPPQSGLTEFNWDGKTTAGTVAPTGTYTFKVVAGSGGNSVSLDPLLTTKVNSVTIDPSSSALTLNTNSGSLALSSVRRVM
ncbi:MAG: flagellar hook assembly protein FlgD [Gammaproteobacteria bacterium]